MASRSAVGLAVRSVLILTLAHHVVPDSTYQAVIACLAKPVAKPAVQTQCAPSASANTIWLMTIVQDAPVTVQNAEAMMQPIVLPAKEDLISIPIPTDVLPTARLAAFDVIPQTMPYVWNALKATHYRQLANVSSA